MQLRTSSTIKFFDEAFRKKFPFDKYKEKDKPTLFFGVYRRSDLQAIKEHEGPKIIWFAGTDAWSQKTLKYVKDSCLNEQTRVIAESNWIERDLDEAGIKYISIAFCMSGLYDWLPEPLGDSLYWYSASSSKYGKKHVRAVRKAFPDLNIITNESTTVPRDQMPEVYKKCFASVRAMEHDGMSQTVAEMGLMGRISIWDGKTPFTTPCEGTETIIEAIKHLRQGYNHKVVAKRARGFFMENEKKWADLVLELCGTDEIGVTGIFKDGTDRCGSIFRIQRKSDIEKIGGLGTSQFERPWFSSQMKRLGKKQIVTTKESGYAASEWKNIDANKGYPDDNFNTHDRGTN